MLRLLRSSRFSNISRCADGMVFHNTRNFHRNRCGLLSPISESYKPVITCNDYNFIQRGRRAGWKVRRREILNRNSIPTLITDRCTDKKFTSPNRSVNLRNLTSVTQSSCNSSDTTSTKNSLKFCLVNAQSLNNKNADFTDYVCHLRADLVAVTETWFSCNESASRVLCTPPGYQLLDSPRLNRNGGGTAILFRDNICVTKVDTAELQCFEYSIWNVKSSADCFRLVIVYRPPNTNTSTFITEFCDLIDSLILCKDQLLITGDFNFHMNDLNDNNAGRFKDILESTGLTQHVSGPTHTHGHTLDLIITRTSECILNGPPIVDRLFSDHFSVVCELKRAKPRITRVKSSYRKLKSIDVAALKTDLAQSNLCLDPPDDLNSLVACYNNTLTTVLDQHAPVITKEITIRPSVPWFNNDIYQLKKLRRKAEKKWRLTKAESDLNNYKLMKNKTTRLMNQAKCEYYTDFINANKSDQRKLFKAVKSLFKFQDNLSFPEYPDKTILSNEIGEYFIQKIVNIRSELDSADIDGSCDIEESEDVLQSRTQGDLLVSFNPLTHKDTNELISKSLKKYCKLDPMPTALVSDCQDVLTHIITKIINLSIENGEVPQDWKEALVYPVPKKANQNMDFNNLRPVSNLSFISKLTERAIYNQLHKHMVTNSLYPKMQSAYRKLHSTETALLKTQNDILLNMNSQQVTLLVLLDLSAAFDTVDHSILLQRLSCFGVTDKALSWFKSYLTGRTQRVSVCGSVSKPFSLNFGVPQGSCLGPLLFIIYSSDLFRVINKHLQDVSAFADDTQIYISFKPDSAASQDFATQVMLNCVDDVKKWMTKSKLKMNESKTEVLLIGTRQQLKKINHGSISIGNDEIAPVTTARNLGCWFDSNMSLKTHIAKTCSAAYFHLRNIKRIRKFLTVDITATLVHAFITSKIDYCNSLLYGLPDCDLIKLQRIQNAAARLITNTSRFNHITPTLAELHWLPVKCRIDYKILLITFKAIHNLAPAYIKQLISVKQSSKYSLRSDTGITLQVPLARSYKTLGDRSFTYAAPKLWNQLPGDLRSCDSVVTFKSLLKTFLFQKHFKGS